jgi:hypothetical protein
VLSHTRVAVLDRSFMLRCSRWPEVTAALFARLSERALRLATHQAISQLTRVDRRLLALFWHLAERWGKMSRDGVVVPLALTHRILGQLVGARRPRSPRRSASSRSATSSRAGPTAPGCCAAIRPRRSRAPARRGAPRTCCAPARRPRARPARAPD